ncbi:LuxR C-terminal-related transcriptional regulator [Nocardioides sambongensis]|uniref:LuxR C-terminal-related transcriptional regulator n=1 Tax=Nocardioides sambongensis TaxID=2589074 RepID=UPI00112D41AD|nr:LuxR C-terminal-related transcriptional regulator [Nocardioides sambongensis]
MTDEQSRDEACEVLKRAGDLLGTSAMAGSRAQVNDLLDSADTSLSQWRDQHPERVAEATEVITELRAARLRLRTEEVVRRRDVTERLQRALRNLQQVESTADLVSQVPDEVAALGFRRVLFSWVDQARWVPVSFHTETGPEEARAVMEAGQPPYWDLHRLLEGEMITHRRPMLVRNALDNPRVHQDIQAVMHSHSYVAAPVIRRAQVVGFVSADQNVELDVVDEVDRDLIHLFAEGVSLALDRVAVLEELGELRRRIGEQAAAMSGLLGDEADVVRRRLRPDVAPEPSWRRALTRREEDVLALVAAGMTNAQIGQRLYVTEGTAKTHVKNLLRKLGVDNRAHAGALYHQHWTG